MNSTKLDAVNACLRGIGSTPVSSLEEPNIDSGIAERVVDSALFDLLQRGWWFNKERGWKLYPDASGDVYIPNNAIDVISVSGFAVHEVAIRGSRLYSLRDHTYNLTNSVGNGGYIEADFIVSLPFDELPAVARSVVTYMARRMFAQDLEADSNRWQFQKREEEQAYTMLERADASHRRPNAYRSADIREFKSNINSFGVSRAFRGL